MARKRNVRGPADPMDIARRRAAERDPANWGLDPAALKLPANADVETRPGAGRKLLRARRVDVFDLFAARGRLSPLAVGAVRRLQADVALLHRTLSAGIDLAPRVDRSRREDPFAGERLAAGERIAAVLALTGTASAQVLRALIEDDVVLGQAGRWRGIVERESGEALAEAQGAVLRAACDNLAGAYAALDRQRRRAGPANPSAESPRP